MLADIFASVGEIGGVYSSSYSTGGNGSKVCDKPRTTVEANNVDNVEGLKAKRDE
jgi:hypothetical protein